MTSALAVFGIAVGTTSLVCYLLMTRSPNRRANRASSGDGSGADDGNYSDGNGWSISDWFGGGHAAFDSSGNPSDFGGADSGSGGDAGGGGGGGGGGD